MSELTLMDWFSIWVIGLVVIFISNNIVKSIANNRRKDYEVVLGINEVMNILAKGIISEKYRDETNKIIDDLIELKKQLSKDS
jgi:hypothetical protein